MWKRWHTAGVLLFVLLLGGITLAATQLDLTTAHRKPNHLGFWAMIALAVLLLLFVMLVGLGVLGRLDGVLVDSRNRLTLSSFQIVVWTIVVLASYGGAYLTNLLAGDSILNAFSVSVPPELWAAMGISGATVVGSAAIKPRQRHIIQPNDAPAQASWGDLFRSDYSPDWVDVSKLQMFVFTILLGLGYAVAVGNLLINRTTHVGKLPDLNDAFLLLLAISHGSYLGRKVAQGLGGEQTRIE